MDLEPYKQQLSQINEVLNSTPDGPEKDELLSLKQNIEELLSLTSNTEDVQDNEHKNDPLQDEYATFMAEMAEVGALDQPSTSKTKNYRDLEGKKFKAPHTHHFGQTVYHNCMVCSVPDDDIPVNEDFEVRVLFLNPTHKEMLPCPYYFDINSNCKFSEEKCNYSHGESVPFSSLHEYVEPKFENLTIGSSVLAKQKNNLWARAKIKYISKEKCLVSFESHTQYHEDIDFEHILPLESSNVGESGTEESGTSEEEDRELEGPNEEAIVNISLLNTPSEEALGNWEKHTKGIGSRLMQKMGYIVGSGLGKDGAGRVDPITAVILPPGKSLV